VLLLPKLVKGFGNIVKPSTQLMKINQKYIWGEAQKQNFRELMNYFFNFLFAMMHIDNLSN
jgi:hypothetical protein